MGLLSLIAALFLEQLHPLDSRRFVFTPLSRLADLIARLFNGGERRHGVVAWCLFVLPPVAVAVAGYYFLYHINPLLAWLWNLLVLYFNMGFRQFSHFYTDIHLALRTGDVDGARQLLGEWRGRSAEGLHASDIARLAIEEALVASHRHVFAVVVWFILLPGPAGAVLYRLTQFLAGHWGTARPAMPGQGGELSRFGDFSREAAALVDWLPVRTTAAAFAIVGDFEDAVYCWRTQAARWLDPALGIVLAAGAGALGVRLGDPLVQGADLEDRPELGMGDEADVDFMQSTIGLVWRALVLWLLLLFLLGLASLVG